MTQNSAEHTPGPWCTNGGLVRTADANNITNRKIASVFGPMGDAEKIANARLIAAAPELLDALEGLSDILSRAESNASGNPEWEFVSKRVNAARAAVEKATRS